MITFPQSAPRPEAPLPTPSPSRPPAPRTGRSLTNLLLAGILVCVATPYVAIWAADWQRQAELDRRAKEISERAALSECKALSEKNHQAREAVEIIRRKYWKETATQASIEANYKRLRDAEAKQEEASRASAACVWG